MITFIERLYPCRLSTKSNQDKIMKNEHDIPDVETHTLNELADMYGAYTCSGERYVATGEPYLVPPPQMSDNDVRKYYFFAINCADCVGRQVVIRMLFDVPIDADEYVDFSNFAWNQDAYDVFYL